MLYHPPATLFIRIAKVALVALSGRRGQRPKSVAGELQDMAVKGGDQQVPVRAFGEGPREVPLPAVVLPERAPLVCGEDGDALVRAYPEPLRPIEVQVNDAG